MNLAVIPARDGSTRLKNKNIYPLGGKPLIRWSTESVLKSNCFDKVVISTDSDEIFYAVSDLPVIRHNRPSILATEKATVLDAMLDLMKGFPQHNTFSYFLPTCPFLIPDDIQKGLSLFEDECVSSVISMTPLETVQLSCLIKNDWVLPIFDNLEKGLTNSKFIKTYYKPSGAFYMSRWNDLEVHKTFFTTGTKGVLIPKERSVDINDLVDITLAQALLDVQALGIVI